jgi:divalent metal cation (Fe/Co/Zn/Cd) transporter
VPDQLTLPRPAASADRWARDARLARRLSLLTLCWLGAESALGLVAGLHAHSVALIGWAGAAMIEALGSLIVVWRFTGARTHSPQAERRARKAVAVSFWALAPYLALHVLHDLDAGHRATPTTLGIAVTTISLIGMPALGLAKRRLGARLGSAATTGEGTQNMLCAIMSAGVLAGLAFTTVGWWWVDPLVALALAVIAVREGLRAWHGHLCAH